MNYELRTNLKGHNVVLFRARAISVGLTLLVAFSALLAGCDEVERSEVLTLFFDGVVTLASSPRDGGFSS